MKGSDFGNDFWWGVAIAAQQNEGAHSMDGWMDGACLYGVPLPKDRAR